LLLLLLGALGYQPVAAHYCCPQLLVLLWSRLLLLVLV
jgi:hypothetical protein